MGHILDQVAICNALIFYNSRKSNVGNRASPPRKHGPLCPLLLFTFLLLVAGKIVWRYANMQCKKDVRCKILVKFKHSFTRTECHFTLLDGYLILLFCFIFLIWGYLLTNAYIYLIISGNYALRSICVLLLQKFDGDCIDSLIIGN